MTSELIPDIHVHDPDQWCCGLPLVGIRAITLEERSRLQSRARKLRNRAVIEFCILLATSVIPLILAFVLRRPAGLHPAFFATAMIGGMFMPILLGRSISQMLAARKISRSLRRAMVHRFSGVLTHESQIAFDRPIPGLDPSLAIRQSLEIFPVTGLILRVNGEPMDDILAVQPRKISRSGSQSVPIAIGVFEESGEETGSFLRNLTNDEKIEIRGHVRYLLRHAVIFGLIRSILGAALVFLIVALARQFFPAADLHSPNRWSEWIFAFSSVSGILWSLITLRKVIRQCRSLAAALREDFVEVLVTQEFLSGEYVWTDGGKPAAWRLIKPS